MTNEKFIELMKKDLKRFIPERKDDIVNKKGESKEFTEMVYWTRHPLTPAIVNKYAKQYRMAPEEFEEYAHRYKTFYEGR
jgi:hypothetical protein